MAILALIVILMGTFYALWEYTNLFWYHEYPPEVYMPTAAMHAERMDADTIRIVTVIDTARNINDFSISININSSEMPMWNITSSSGLSFTFDYNSTHYVIDFHDLNSDGKLNSQEYFEIHTTGDLPDETEYTTNLYFPFEDWKTTLCRVSIAT